MSLLSENRQRGPIHDLFKTRGVFVLKWVASIIQIFGYTATALGMTPLNIYLFLVGLVGWFMVGYFWRDRAIMAIHVVALGAMIFGMSNS